ncbi:unnamed protein product [Zymoseptoria tritici ST99CH_3D1]|nr:unnamed protein product [Zymoseptoria tritici ST99CH_3D1]
MAIPPKNVPPDAMPCSATSADEGPVEKSSSPSETTEITKTTETAETAELPCPLLELSAELRNKIWELHYSDDKSTKRGIALLDAKGPSPALLLTCRQAKSDSSGFFKTAHLRFWKKKSFALSVELYDHDNGEYFPVFYDDQVQQRLLGLKDMGFELITHCEISLFDDWGEIHCWPVSGTKLRVWEMRMDDGHTGAIVVGIRRATLTWTPYGDYFSAKDARQLLKGDSEPALSPGQKCAQVWQIMREEAPCLHN